MEHSISNFLPSKMAKQTNSKNNYDKFNKPAYVNAPQKVIHKFSKELF